MEKEFALKPALTEVADSLLTSLADLIPRVLTAIVVILIGFLVAKLIERALNTTFARLRIDAMLERIGVTGLLRQIGYRASPSRGFTRIVYFLLIVLFTQSATQSVGLIAIADAIRSFFAYVPSIIAAFVIVLLGGIVSRAAGHVVAESGKSSGMDYAETLGRIVSGLLLFVVAIMAITQLKIDTAVIRSVALVILSGIALGFALSFGLGTRQLTRNVVAGFYARKLFDEGERIEIDGVEGTLLAVTPVKTMIQRADDIVAVSNDAFLKGAVRI